ncbi:hypothetical protein [Paenibacillus zeisoli]|nr:hypothetical protein [Paenibacillus zeisoli]
MEKRSTKLDKVIIIGGLLGAGVLIILGLLIYIGIKYNVIRLN